MALDIDVVSFLSNFGNVEEQRQRERAREREWEQSMVVTLLLFYTTKVFFARLFHHAKAISNQSIYKNVPIMSKNLWQQLDGILYVVVRNCVCAPLCWKLIGKFHVQFDDEVMRTMSYDWTSSFIFVRLLRPLNVGGGGVFVVFFGKHLCKIEIIKGELLFMLCGFVVVDVY